MQVLITNLPALIRDHMINIAWCQTGTAILCHRLHLEPATEWFVFRTLPAYGTWCKQGSYSRLNTAACLCAFISWQKLANWMLSPCGSFLKSDEHWTRKRSTRRAKQESRKLGGVQGRVNSREEPTLLPRKLVSGGALIAWIRSRCSIQGQDSTLNLQWAIAIHLSFFSVHLRNSCCLWMEKPPSLTPS